MRPTSPVPSARRPGPRFAIAFVSALVACSSPAPAPHRVAKPPPSAPPGVARAPAPDGPPAAPVREARDNYFGTEVVDPYRWMEAPSPEFDAWMKAQADYARRSLDARPARPALLARLRELDAGGTKVWGVQRRGPWAFSNEIEPGDVDHALYVRKGLGGAKRKLVDPQAYARGAAPASLDYSSPSPDGGLVAYGVSLAGSENATLYVVDTATGRALPDVIDRARQASPAWLDGKHFFYRRTPELAAGAPESRRQLRVPVYLHALGSDPARDEPVFGYGVSPAVDLPENAWAWVTTSAGGDYLVAAYNDGVRPEVTLYVAPRAALAGPKTPWRRLATYDDKVVGYDLHGNVLYLMSRRGAPRGRLLRLDLRRSAELARATTVLEQDAVAVLQWAEGARDALYVRRLEGGIGRAYRLPYGGGALEPIATGANGTVSYLSTDETTPGALFGVNSWTQSPAVYAVEPGGRAATDTGLAPPSKVSFDDVVAVETTARGADGTPVPLSILHRRGLARDGSSPAHLNGYASYGNVYGPTFEPTRLAWLERGGVWAYCHARGGGEFGEAWHEAGKLATKPATVADFLACARHLVDEKYTSPARLGGQGTSAGGILIGNAIVERPDLFGAAVVRVGMVNALRFEQIPIGPFNTSEFGSVATKEGFDMLRAIDAYHKVAKGKAYPAVLLTTGASDTRVSPWQSAKFAARLQAAGAGGRPVLLRVEYEGGHGATRALYLNELADVYTFLLAELAPKP
jgi:prolyl oligopeptidase